MDNNSGKICHNSVLGTLLNGVRFLDALPFAAVRNNKLIKQVHTYVFKTQDKFQNEKFDIIASLRNKNRRSRNHAYVKF